MEDLAYEWVDQYAICPREQGSGRGLDFFWDRLDGCDAGAVVNRVCQVLPSLLPHATIVHVFY
jgi:hypothetical protein